MIKVEHLSFSYGQHKVLEDISFSTNDGELLCLLGCNGAGKSTLFKCILGILKKYEGTITLDGQDMAELKPREKARLVAYIPQATNPAFAYSVMDMVLMGTTANMSNLSNPGDKEREVAMVALKRMGIEHLAGRDYTRISGGEQQLVLIARAIAQGASYLIMDEPTSSLDYGNQLRVQQQLRLLAREGYTIIESTHNPEQTYMFADRIICIRDGRIYSNGRPSEVMDEKMIKDLYGVDVDMLTTRDHRVRFFELRDSE